MATDEIVMQLKAQMTTLRDQGLDFLTYSERFLKENIAEDYTPSSQWFTPSTPEPDYWSLLPQAYADRGLQLRAEARQIMSDVASVAQRAILVDKADLVALGKNTKRIAASMRLRKFTAWGIEIHHDEGAYIGSDPPGQSETTTNIDVCRSEFIEALETTFELLQILGSRNETKSFGMDATTNLRTYRPGTAFIMMRINPEQPDLKDVRDTVVAVFKKYGVTAVRADDLEHSEGITDRIIKEIKESEHLFTDLTGERPSVYYEIGYAHAIGKSPMLYRKKGTPIHFDLAYRNCPEYENLSQLREMLDKRLSVATGRSPS